MKKNDALRELVGQGLGRVLKAHRGKRKQAELAERAGIRPNNWSLYESGKRLPGKENFERLAGVFKIPIPEFVGEIMEACRAVAGEERPSGDRGDLRTQAQREEFARLLDIFVEQSSRSLETFRAMVHLWAGLEP